MIKDVHHSSPLISLNNSKKVIDLSYTQFVFQHFVIITTPWCEVKLSNNNREINQ